MTRASLDRRRFPTVWADIDLHALGRNLTTLRRRLPVGMAVYGVVKADAYGHGGPAVARALQHAGVDGLVVADLEEGTALRRVGIERPVLVLDPPLPQQAAPIAAQGLTATVTSIKEADILAGAAARTDTAAPVPVHVRVGTGSGGLGAPPGLLLDLLAAIDRAPALRLAGLYTHLSGSESMAGLRELERFGALVAQADAAGLLPPLVHALSSSALDNPALAAAAQRIGCTAVRCGSLLYGLRAVPGPTPFPYTPVMAVKARIIRLATLEPGDGIPEDATLSAGRQTRAALVPIGYADAQHLLHLANGSLLVRGHEVPILGTPLMSSLLADVSTVPDAQPGDEVVLFGTQEGAALPAEALAERSGLPPSAIPLLGPRVARHYRTIPRAETAPV
ncbi:alanine racemase [Azospirillum rugosum]|uniref:alanine racemase n=1 Tax=Azospirillum rugosum TaxID=416170 RepID=A0ABS4SK51_9PROT|nr:alanine racemase [Azospirillum rugosum]MBP2292934.1 alanine racemase [Azospirillum rugosum]MDQ0529314.1 alanine racemase [Azospirillum rugosum]